MPPVLNDYNKTFTFHPDKDVSRDPLKWVLSLSKDSISIMCTDWCRENCVSKWAWWFDNQYCYIGFENFYEYNLFKITYYDQLTYAQ